MDGTSVYVDNDGEHTITHIDVATDSILGRVTGVNGAWGLIMDPRGGVAYDTARGHQEVWQINLVSDTPVWGVPVGVNPRQPGITPDGSRVYVPLQADPGSVMVIDTVLQTVIDTFSVGPGPFQVAITPL